MNSGIDDLDLDGGDLWLVDYEQLSWKDKLYRQMKQFMLESTVFLAKPLPFNF